MNVVSCEGKRKISSALGSVEPHHHISMGGEEEGVLAVGSRIEEGGNIHLVEPKRWGLVFEGLPLWLLALTKINIVKLIFLDWSSLTEFDAFLKAQTSLLIKVMCQSLNVNQIVFGSHQEVDVMLYSGNLNFLRSKSQLLLSKSILLLNTPWKSRGFPCFGAEIGIRWRVYAGSLRRTGQREDFNGFL